MILREIKNIFIKNRLTEGVDFVRKEWLKGDGRAYIDTKVTDLSISDYIKFIFDDSGNIGVRARTWGREGNRLVVGNDGNTSVCVIWGVSSNSNIWYNNNGIYVYDMYFDLLNNKIIINNQTYSIALPHGNGVSFLLFARHNSDNGVDFKNWAKYKSFEIHNQINLTPCQLLKFIPATLDANNRTRQAGECGMYDSISGKFFGNVANSGTFTVEGDVEPETHTGLQQIYQNKLIEGIDYETYDWLKAEIPIGTSMINLPINSRNFEFQRNFIQLMNSGYFLTSNANSNYSYYITDIGQESDKKPRVWNDSTLSTVYVSKYIGLGIHFIIANDDGITISSITDTASLPWYGNPKSINFNNSSNVNKHTIHLTSSIKVDGVTRYVPCKLLRSIPRNLDAQCKERVAGECGMIDIISGKFYGNVASSGTFTVENDNNE